MGLISVNHADGRGNNNNFAICIKMIALLLGFNSFRLLGA